MLTWKSVMILSVGVPMWNKLMFELQYSLKVHMHITIL